MYDSRRIFKVQYVKSKRQPHRSTQYEAAKPGQYPYNSLCSVAAEDYLAYGEEKAIHTYSRLALPVSER